MNSRIRYNILFLQLFFVLMLVSGQGRAAPPLMTRDDIICRAKSGVGYSYHWGGACWCQSGCSPNFGSCSAGGCSGSCPGCNHYGTYGADCSGYVTKIWQIPNAIAVNSCGHGPYVAANYMNTTANWTAINRNNISRGDAFASTTHVLLYESGSPWGSIWAYEAMGCSWGIVHGTRSCGGNYAASRRNNLGTPCACTPGQLQSGACGNCGTRQRTCQSNCQWGAWGACTGQGPCAPGSQQSRDCCDCGSQTRTCGSNCEWGGYSSCAGPDPDGGNLVCDTQQPGPCADGRVRCIEGCKTCVRVYEPIDEICDGIDNDCSGVIDDGFPTVLGDPPPAYAATMVDSSVPSALGPKEKGMVWAAFRNDGTAVWYAHEIWMGVVDDEEASSLYEPGAWPAHDVAAILESDVPPGETGYFSWSVRAPEKENTASQVFRLMDPKGAWLMCPSPQVEVRLVTTGRTPDSSSNQESTVVNSTPTSEESSGCSCRTGSSSSPSLWWLGFVGLGWSRIRKTRKDPLP